jgi:hypothetical protein
MRKDEVEYHQLGYGYQSAPAVNVKVQWPYPYGEARRKLLADVEREAGEPGFAVWAEERFDADDWPMWAFEAACADGWDWLQDCAEELFGKGTKVYSEGRSGGWRTSTE